MKRWRNNAPQTSAISGIGWRSPAVFQASKADYRISLARADSEWPLQVLNDIRVGHWLRLGSPEPGQLIPQNLKPQQLSAWLAMEMSGYCQMIILTSWEH